MRIHFVQCKDTTSARRTCYLLLLTATYCYLKFCHGLTRTFPQLGRICNPAVRSIRIYNPGKDVLSALKMQILRVVGLQIRPSGVSTTDKHGLFLLPLGRICNPAARSIRIYNPGKDVLSALKMLILSKVGLQIRPSGFQFARHDAPPLGRMMYRRSVGFAIRPPGVSGFIIREKIC